MNADWGQAIVVDPRMLRSLSVENDSLRAALARHGQGLRLALSALVLATGAATCTMSRATHLARTVDGVRTTAAREVGEARRQVRRARAEAERASQALGTLARSHEHVLAASEQVQAVGTKSWGRRFTVTKYLARDPSYGKFNDGLTATMKKADPNDRIVAVDPTLVPYGSWVWIEELGWFRAEDCGAAIKGFRLDVLSPSAHDAMAFGRQDRFVIVVPPTDA